MCVRLLCGLGTVHSNSNVHCHRNRTGSPTPFRPRPSGADSRTNGTVCCPCRMQLSPGTQAPQAALWTPPAMDVCTQKCQEAQVGREARRRQRYHVTAKYVPTSSLCSCRPRPRGARLPRPPNVQGRHTQWMNGWMDGWMCCSAIAARLLGRLPTAEQVKKGVPSTTTNSSGGLRSDNQIDTHTYENTANLDQVKLQHQSPGPAAQLPSLIHT